MGKYRKRGFVGSIDGSVTEREIKHRALARKAAAESFVLLKNDGLLPIEKGTKLGLYGRGATKTVKGGTGSGDVNERDCVSIYQGLLNAGYDIVSSKWCLDYEKAFDLGRSICRDKVWKLVDEGVDLWKATWEARFIPSAGDSLPESAKDDGADTAIYVLSRIAGEGSDRHPVKGDYYISDEELEILRQISSCYKNILLVINTGGLVDLGFVDEFDNIKAIIQFMQAGQEGGNAFADVISGDVTPSGKLADTWPKAYEDYPNAMTFSHMNGDLSKEEYIDGIYVGYRYFDTFEVPVRYGFGYGLSYTDFDITTDSFTVLDKGTNNPKLTLSVTVKNTGSEYSGKEVVQVYASCPQGKLDKEFRRLTAFAKTEQLAPGEAQRLDITFEAYSLASYDEDMTSYILEKGNYYIWVGNSLQSSVPAAKLTLDDDTAMVKCEHICKRQQPLTEIKPDASKLAKRCQALEASEIILSAEISAADIVSECISYSPFPEEYPKQAKKIVDEMTLDQLIALATGEPSMGQGSIIGAAGQSVPGAAAETTLAAEELGVASIVLADGPAGLRLSRTYQVRDGQILKVGFMETMDGGYYSRVVKEPGETTYYQYCTAIPVGALLAQSWDVELVEKVGEMIGEEMNLFETTLWLAPGMNIHRNPLCGRNFEYYSEDPLVSGAMASAMTIGVQRIPGCGTTIKHFATNNSEDNRMGVDSVINERALREIYLKGFEIAVKNSQPMAIMTSYNQINGVHAANCYDTCTMAARNEWGFAGMIMTDWDTTVHSTAGISTASGCIKAGNDITMPGTMEDREDIRTALENGAITLDELKRCVCNTVNIILQSNQYENPVSYLDQFKA